MWRLISSFTNFVAYRIQLKGRISGLWKSHQKRLKFISFYFLAAPPFPGFNEYSEIVINFVHTLPLIIPGFMTLIIMCATVQKRNNYNGDY